MLNFMMHYKLPHKGCNMHCNLILLHRSRKLCRWNEQRNI